MLKKYILANLFTVCLASSACFASQAPTMDKNVALALASKENMIRSFNELPNETKTQFDAHHKFILSIVEKCIDAASKLKEGKEHSDLIKKANYYLRIWESRLKNLKHAVVDIKADEAKTALLSTEGLVGDDKIFGDALLEIIKANLKEITITTDSYMRGSLIRQLAIDIKQLESFLKKSHKAHPQKTDITNQTSSDKKTDTPQQSAVVVK